MISISINVPNIKWDITSAIKKSLWQSSMLVRREATKRAPYQTGTLRRSIVEKVNWMKATVGTNLVYAKIHEYGWIIKPKRWKYLRFKIWGRRVTTKQVRIKKKPYMTPALQAMKSKIDATFAKNIRDSLGSQ